VVLKKKEFPIRHMKGAAKAHIRTAEDISDVWRFIKMEDQMVLWFQGNILISK